MKFKYLVELVLINCCYEERNQDAQNLPHRRLRRKNLILANLHRTLSGIIYLCVRLATSFIYG